MILPEINSEQERFLCMISRGADGGVEMPSTREELISMLESYRLMYNYEKHEEGLMFYSAKAFLKTLTRLGERDRDSLGFAYISSVMQVVEKRKFFKSLSESTKNRGVKAERHLIEYLIRKKWIAVHGSQARVTVEGTSRLSHMELVNQY